MASRALVVRCGTTLRRVTPGAHPYQAAGVDVEARLSMDPCPRQGAISLTGGVTVTTPSKNVGFSTRTKAHPHPPQRRVGRPGPTVEPLWGAGP